MVAASAYAERMQIVRAEPDLVGQRAVGIGVAAFVPSSGSLGGFGASSEPGWASLYNSGTAATRCSVSMRNQPTREEPRRGEPLQRCLVRTSNLRGNQVTPRWLETSRRPVGPSGP